MRLVGAGYDAGPWVAAAAAVVLCAAAAFVPPPPGDVHGSDAAAAAVRRGVPAPPAAGAMRGNIQPSSPITWIKSIARCLYSRILLFASHEPSEQSQSFEL